ncbi:hypothetical protein ACFYWX_39610 [Streptomyces sp. NPDC002888]|uniref:hypothetical protein n=1 Tax=Streptomyces sp. NPDC002888 TaxID=3364668 RepID=UPI0036B20D2F
MAPRDGWPERARERYARAPRRTMSPRLRHTVLAARIARDTRRLGAGPRPSAAGRRVLDGLVELGLGRGRLTPTVELGLGRALVALTRLTSRPQEPA